MTCTPQATSTAGHATRDKYANALRELERITEAHRHGDATDGALNEARQDLHEAEKAWNEEKSAAFQAINGETRSGKGIAATYPNATDEPTDELAATKRLITACRKELVLVREENHTLYAQLKTNRETKAALNAEYERLRAKKKTLEATP